MQSGHRFRLALQRPRWNVGKLKAVGHDGLAIHFDAAAEFEHVVEAFDHLDMNVEYITWASEPAIPSAFHADQDAQSELIVKRVVRVELHRRMRIEPSGNQDAGRLRCHLLHHRTRHNRCAGEVAHTEILIPADCCGCVNRSVFDGLNRLHQQVRRAMVQVVFNCRQVVVMVWFHGDSQASMWEKSRTVAEVR